MVGEYRALYADVRQRLDVARADVVGDVDTAVQVTAKTNLLLSNNIPTKSLL